MKKIVKVLNKYKLQKFKKYIFARKHKMKIPFKPSFKLSPATFLGYLSFAFFFGFLIMHLQTVFNSTKLLQYDVRNKDITGQISNIEKRSLDYRVTLKNIKIAFDDTEYKKIRVKTNNVNNLHIGDKISFKGSLFAPSGPSSDSGFNFKRWAFYEGFSATGYVNDKIEILDKGILSFKEHIANLRVKIINKLSESSMEGNLFAITILTGERYALPDESQEIFQKAGISHLLSVSGFHMGLIALITFFLIRYFILLLFPSQMFDGKKLTAILTFPIITAFYFLSGMAIPATRSFIMILVFLISVIKGRKVLSLNNLGLAGFIILCLYPYSLFSAGFQLSFAATAVIIYLFNKK